MQWFIADAAALLRAGFMGCTTIEHAAPSLTSYEVANTFASICLRAVQDEVRLAHEFREVLSFKRGDRLGPEPGALVYDSPQGMTGVGQRFWPSDDGTEMCYVYGSIIDVSALRPAVEAALRSAIPTLESNVPNARTGTWRISVPDGRVFSNCICQTI